FEAEDGIRDWSVTGVQTWLFRSRYAILAIFIIAAVVTPTPDVVNLMLFATPMCLLFYAGIFASYLLVLQREHRTFPWGVAITIRSEERRVGKECRSRESGWLEKI